MKIPERFIPLRYKRLVRTKEIVKILAKHFGVHLIEQLELTRYLPFKLRQRIVSDKDYQLPLPQRIRRCIEDLGPTFVKLGQLASTRPDLIPPEYIKELARLQDEVPPFPFEDVKKVIKEELKKDIEEVFQYFSPTPIASASIGQVHHAILKDGREVVVKVQRPEIREKISLDMSTLRGIGIRLESVFLWARLYNFVDRVDEFAKVILQEMDYILEGKNADRLRRNFENEQSIKIPTIYWEFCTTRVLTMEFIHGIKIADKKSLIEKGHNLTQAAEVIGNAFIKMILIDGFFHGDPHFGNIFILEDGTVALIDFGMAGMVDPVMKKIWAKYFTAIINLDAPEVVEQLYRMAKIDPATDRDDLTRAVGKLLSKYAGVTLSEIKVDEIVIELFNIGMKYKISFPGEYTLMDKTLLTLDGLGRHLDPNFDLLGEAQKVLNVLIREEAKWENLSKQFIAFLIEGRDLIYQFPKRINKLYEMFEKGQFTLQIENKTTENSINLFAKKFNIIVNKLSISIILSALLIVSSNLLIRKDLKIIFNLTPQNITLIIIILLSTWIFFLIKKTKL